MPDTIYIGQGVAKDCIVGDRLINRYAIFNGLDRPRVVDSNGTVSILGFDTPTILSVNSVGSPAGSLQINKYYSYKAVFASSKYTRPTAVLDGSSNYTRGNPSSAVTTLSASANSSMEVGVYGNTNSNVTHILLYRSSAASSAASAAAGPFYYVAQKANDTSGSAVYITDGLADASHGQTVETNNNQPNSYRYAIAAAGYIFAGGNLPIGSGYTCTVTAGSSVVTANGTIFYEGIRGWTFKLVNDTTGGVDNMGTYYANFTDSQHLALVDASGTAKTYNGSLSGSGRSFMVYLPGNVLRWSKYGEPEAWPTDNLINFEGDITGISTIPNMPLMLVCTDTPNMYILDTSLIGTSSFKTTRRIISTEFSATSHYSLIGVEGKVRGIDASRGAIFETDGSSVNDITKFAVPHIWSKLSRQSGDIKNWHCAYDPRQHLFGAFVALEDNHRMVDFCIGQNTITGSWFFNFEKDLLSSAQYVDPSTKEIMVLGGTQGSGAFDAVWGRVWSPSTFSEWVPAGYLTSGTITAATTTTITVDNTTQSLWTSAGGLAGRWVLVCDSNGEYQQMAYILGNTANVITVRTVKGSTSSVAFDPTPVAGWKFYLGMIEMRWGTKRFDFEDPEHDKKLLDVILTVSSYNTSDLPFVRFYRGMATGYTYQRPFVESRYVGGTSNDVLITRHNDKGEPSPRWGITVVDRSYEKTIIRSMTIVFSRIGEKASGDKR